MYRVRGRMLLFWLALAIALSGLATHAAIPAALGGPLPATLQFGVWGLLCYVLLFVFLLRPLGRRGTTFGHLMGPTPGRSAAGWAFLTAVGLIGVSVASVYALFVPLSYVAPDAVTSWLFEDPPVVFWRTGEYRWLANAILFVAAVIAAPLAEEFLFRGLLLPAWTARLDEKAAIILTSLCFAVLHADILGGFVFAVVMAVVFARTGSLWMPVLIHGFNNGLAWLIAVAYAIAGLEETPSNVAQLQSTWWHGVVGLAVGLPLLLGMLRKMPGRSAPAPAGSDSQTPSETQSAADGSDHRPRGRRPRLKVFPHTSLLFKDTGARVVDIVRPDDLNLDEAFESIRCPLCAWQPDARSRWRCDCRNTPEPAFESCGAVWNTFATRGQCPGCAHQWRWTSCLACGQFSPHDETKRTVRGHDSH